MLLRYHQSSLLLHIARHPGSLWSPASFNALTARQFNASRVSFRYTLEDSLNPSWPLSAQAE